VHIRSVQQPASKIGTFRGIRFDPIAAALFLIGVLLLLWTSRLNFLSQDANWDLLNYHAYDPASLFGGTWLTDIHPAGGGSYVNPNQDLLFWPLVSGIPSPIGSAILIAIQVSIFIPVGLIIRTLLPAISRPRAFGLGLVGLSGAMVATELGTTMGDIPPALLLAWSLYLLLSVIAQEPVRAERRAVIAGLLVGGAVALKYTVIYTFPGLLVFVIALVLAGKRRSAALFFVTSAAVAIVLCGPWAVVLQTHMGSPVFPMFNGFFHAPRIQAIDMGDARFPIVNLPGLLKLPIRQALGTAYTAEEYPQDIRWLIGFVAVGLGAAAVAFAVFKRRTRPSWRSNLPGLTLMAFWCVSYVAWAFIFGTQRYAVLLEVLALPVIAFGLWLALPPLAARRASLPTLLLLVVFMAGTTRIVDFGRRPMDWSPIIPSETIEPLTRYDAILVGGEPLASLRAVTRDAPGASRQLWVGAPFDAADAAVEKGAIAGRSVGVIFYTYQHDGAAVAAANLGLVMTEDCAFFDSPLYNSVGLGAVELCAAKPSS
jgi:hypothetical protein